MKLKLITIVILLITTQITMAAICSQANNSIGLLGFDYTPVSGTVPEKTNIYASLLNHSNLHCGCTEVRFEEVNTNIDVVLDILLAAKTNFKKVRIDLLDANNCDSAFRVFIQ